MTKKEKLLGIFFKRIESWFEMNLVECKICMISTLKEKPLKRR